MTGFPSAAPFMMNPVNNEADTTAFKAAQQAQMVSQNFGVPMQGSNNPGMWANILPAAIQIEEHKKMNQVAQKYQDQYVNQFKERYGFTDDDTRELQKEFKEITDHITDLIPDKELKTMYAKYVSSYPNMYLSMIPAEALQSKLAVKCHRDNLKLRKEVQEMSKCVTTLVQGLSKLQMTAGVPPIVSLMFESMPDPLTAITDPMYSSYNEAITTYHALAGAGSYGGAIDSGISGKDGQLNASAALLSSPIKALDKFIEEGVDILVGKNSDDVVTQDQIKALKTVIENMGTSSGCQTYGDEWNHTGPEPAMNPAMCLGKEQSMQPGNPRNAHGRTAVYQAQRTQDGGAQWVMKGQVPNPMGQAPAMYEQSQLLQSAKYGQQPAGDWANYAQAPAPRRTSSKKKSKTTKKKGGRKASK